MSTPPPPPLSTTFPGGCYLLFNSVINWEATERLIAAVVNAINAGYQRVDVCMSSPGGTVDYAFHLLNVLGGLPVQLVMHNVGSIKSAGIVVYMAGSERLACKGTTFFFHETTFADAGSQNTTSVEKRLESIKKDDERTMELLSRATNQPIEAVREWQARDTTMNESEALALGVVQRIESLVIPANAHIERIAVG